MPGWTKTGRKMAQDATWRPRVSSSTSLAAGNQLLKQFMVFCPNHDSVLGGNVSASTILVILGGMQRSLMLTNTQPMVTLLAPSTVQVSSERSSIWEEKSGSPYCSKKALRIGSTR